MEEKSTKKRDYKDFLGYFLPMYPLTISTVAIFGALVCVVTMLFVFPIPATQGFINIGDAMVMITALLFGPVVGCLAGGIGSGMADIFLGYTIYAPGTMIIKGLEGFIVGLIANPRKKEKNIDLRDVVGVIAGGLVMVFGYFFYEILLFGVEIAMFELILNGFFQFGIGAIIAIIFTAAARKNIVESLPQFFDKIYIAE